VNREGLRHPTFWANRRSPRMVKAFAQLWGREDLWVSGGSRRAEALRTLTTKPIAAKRGDMVLWHASLPHGSSQNRAKRPGLTQDFAMRPSRWAYNKVWE